MINNRLVAVLLEYFEHVLYVITPLMFALLLAMVGYSSLNLSYLHTKGNWLAACAVAAATVAFVWYFIKYVTYIVYRENGVKSIGLLGGILWVALFAVSGYSLISFVVIVEFSPKIIGKTATDAVGSYAALKNYANVAVYGGEYSEFMDKIEGAKKSLHKEIFNKVPEKRRPDGRILTCGIGAENVDEGARKILNYLEKELPGYRPKRFLETREHDCSKMDNLMQLEKEVFEDIDEQVDKVRQVRFDMKRRGPLYNRLEDVVGVEIAKLKGIASAAQQPVARFNLPFLLEANRALFASHQEYQRLVAELRGLSLELPESVSGGFDVSAVQEVGDYLGIMSFLGKALGPNRLTLFVVTAALYDLTVMTLLGFYARTWVRRRDRFRIEQELYGIRDTGVEMLLLPRK